MVTPYIIAKVVYKFIISVLYPYSYPFRYEFILWKKWLWFTLDLCTII